MTVKNATGTPQSKTAVMASMVDITPDENKVFRFNGGGELYEHLTLPGHSVVDGDRRLAFAPGQRYTKTQIDNLFPLAVVNAITPNTGPVAGGTVLTITGDHLTGVTNVAFGATNGTALQVITEHEIRVTTPAKAAATYDVVLTDDAGTVTVPGGFTYA